MARALIVGAVGAMLLVAILACVDTSSRSSASSYASSLPSAYTACDATDAASIAAGFVAAGRSDVVASAEADLLAASTASVMAAASCDDLTSLAQTHLAYRAGLYDHHVETEAQLWHGHVDESAVAAFARGVGTDLAGAMPQCPLVVGAARAVNGTETFVVVVAAARCVTLSSPLPRTLALGGALDLHGSVAAGLTPLSVALTTPDGRVSTDDLGSALAWQHTFATAGRYVIEVVVQRAPTGPTPVLKAELFVGADEPPLVAPCRPSATGATPDTITRTLTLINESRAQLGVAPLVLDAQLAAAAQGHSDDMVRQHYFGHWSPTGSTPETRAAGSGAAVSRVGENVAEGSDATEMHDSLMESPGHRASILDPLFTHVGLGVAVNGEELDLTELFGTIAPPLDVARDRPAVVASIGSALGHAISTDARLDSAAQSAAERFFTAEAPSELDVRQDALRRAAGVATVRESAASWRIGALGEVPQMELFRQGFDHFGIGLAQGRRADGPPSEYIAVVIAAQLHADAIDTVSLEHAVFDALSRERSAHGAPPVARMDALGAVSRQLAARWLGGETPTTLYQSANDQRPALGLEHAGLRYQCGGIRAAEDVLRWTTPLDPQVRRIGIGIAQGTHDGVDGAIGMFVLGVTD